MRCILIKILIKLVRGEKKKTKNNFKNILLLKERENVFLCAFFCLIKKHRAHFFFCKVLKYENVYVVTQKLNYTHHPRLKMNLLNMNAAYVIDLHSYQLLDSNLLKQRICSRYIFIFQPFFKV